MDDFRPSVRPPIRIWLEVIAMKSYRQAKFSAKRIYKKNSLLNLIDCERQAGFNVKHAEKYRPNILSIVNYFFVCV